MPRPGTTAPAASAPAQRTRSSRANAARRALAGPGVPAAVLRPARCIMLAAALVGGRHRDRSSRCSPRRSIDGPIAHVARTPVQPRPARSASAWPRSALGVHRGRAQPATGGGCRPARSPAWSRRCATSLYAHLQRLDAGVPRPVAVRPAAVAGDHGPVGDQAVRRLRHRLPDHQRGHASSSIVVLLIRLNCWLGLLTGVRVPARGRALPVVRAPLPGAVPARPGPAG